MEMPIPFLSPTDVQEHGGYAKKWGAYPRNTCGVVGKRGNGAVPSSQGGRLQCEKHMGRLGAPSGSRLIRSEAARHFLAPSIDDIGDNVSCAAENSLERR